MDELRKPFLMAVLALVGLMVLLELGAAAFLQGQEAPENLGALLPAGEVREAFDNLDNNQKAALSGRDTAPGLAISYLALLDGIWLFSMGLIAAGLFLPENLQGKTQGCLTSLFAIVIIIIGFSLLLTALNLLQLMVALLLATPFGTLAYLAAYGFFNRGGAAIALSLLTILKGGAAICLVLAQQRFLQNKGLLLLIFTSLVANILITLLHGAVPAFLVSVTDAVAALIVALLGLMWAIFLLVGGAISIFKTFT